MLSNKLLCDLVLPIRSVLFLFSLAMSIVVLCRDPCPSAGPSVQSTVQGYFSKRDSQLFSGGFCSTSHPARWMSLVSGSG